MSGDEREAVGWFCQLWVGFGALVSRSFPRGNFGRGVTSIEPSRLFAVDSETLLRSSWSASSFPCPSVRPSFSLSLLSVYFLSDPFLASLLSPAAVVNRMRIGSSVARGFVGDFCFVYMESIPVGKPPLHSSAVVPRRASRYLDGWMDASGCAFIDLFITYRPGGKC